MTPEPEPAEASARNPRPKLVYPIETAPGVGTGEVVEAAPGVHWLRMPMFGGLKFVNIYVLADGDGWTVIDTGLRTKETTDAWRIALAGPLAGRPVKRVIGTHMHPDHIGMAGWIIRKHPGATLWMSRLEYITGRMLVADSGREAPEDGVRFFHAAGWGEDAIESYKARFGGFGKGVYPLPDSYRRISDNQTIRIGADDWRVVTGAGHSPEHVCLWQPERKLFLSGDQVLPLISSNVSLFPTEPDADPLDDWLTALAKVKAAIPEDVLTLPGHNDPFQGLHPRIDHLIRGHEISLARLESLLAEPRRAVDTFGALFGRAIGPELLGLATGEALAHLNCLYARGRVRREADGDGVVWWRQAA